MTDTVVVNDSGNIIEVLQGDNLTVCKIVKTDLEMEDIKFIQLDDTPSNYDNAAGKTVTVNDDGTGLIFSKTYNSFVSLNDTPTSYEEASGNLVAVNKQGTGLTFLNYSPNDITIAYFTQLADTFRSYTNRAGYIVNVKSTEDGLQATSFDDLMPNQNIATGSYNYPKMVVNQKGVITSIQEGSPFTFPPFESDRLLIGNGTTTPAQLYRGNINEVITTTTSGVMWQLPHTLYDYFGYQSVNIYSDSASSHSTLQVHSTNDSITITQEEAGDDLILGINQALVLTPQLVIVNTNNVRFETGFLETGDNGLIINPGPATVKINPTIDSTIYSNRIQSDNDLVTKRYFDDHIPHQQEIKDVLRCTGLQSISANSVYFDIPVNARITQLTINITQEFNLGAKIKIIDNYSQTLFNMNTCPDLTEIDTVVLYLNQIAEADYNVEISCEDYIYGSADIFLSYFL